MSLTGWFAIMDGVVAIALLLSIPRQKRIRAAVVAVALLLLGASGWLGALAVDDNEPTTRTPVPAPAGTGQTV